MNGWKIAAIIEGCLIFGTLIGAGLACVVYFVRRWKVWS